MDDNVLDEVEKVVKEDEYSGIHRNTATGAQHEIKHLPLEAVWQDEIYMWENGDKIIGGITGLQNLQAQELGNNLLWLKTQVQKIQAYLNKYRPDGVIKYEVKAGENVSEQIDKVCLDVEGLHNQDISSFKVEDESGKQFEIINGDTVFEMDNGYKFALKYGNEFDENTTIPGETDTLPAENVTVPAENDTNYVTDDMVDDFLDDLFGGD